jgi:hypothetical protein
MLKLACSIWIPELNFSCRTKKIHSHPIPSVRLERIIFGNVYYYYFAIHCWKLILIS